MSKSIDERVVEMRFDNSNFAKNVKDTINQVSDLNKSLNSIEPGSAEDSLLRIATAAEGLQKRFSVVGTAIGRMVENITDTLQRKVTNLMSFVTNGIKSGGMSRAMKLEAAQFKLQGILRNEEDSAQQIKDIMDDVNYGVADTAYGLDAAASVASQLAATGMRAGTEMKQALRGISGVAAMTGSSYEEIGHIFTTVSGQGKVMGEQLNQLAVRGLNAAAILAESLGKTEEEVHKMVSKGQIDFATFSKAMDDAFGEHAKDANKTFTGAMSNIRAALAKIGAMFIQPLIRNEGPLVDMLNAIRVWLNDLRNYLGPLAKGFQDTIEGIANWVKDLFSVKLASPFRIFSNYLDGAGVKMDDFIGYLKEAGDAAKFPIRATIQEYGSLEKALSSGKIDKSIVMDAIHRMTGEAESAHNALGKTTRTAEDYYDIVHKIWIEGAYGHTETRWKRLEEEGWDAMYVQQLVNDSVYSGYINLERLDDEHLRAAGISKEHTEILKSLQKQAEETGIPIEELVDDMLRPSGHELFFAGLYNIGKAVANIFTAIGNAYRRIFPAKSRDYLYQLIKGFYDFTDALANNEEVCKALENTFAGIFAVLDIIITFIKGVATAVLKGVGTVITELAGGVFEATGAFGEGLVAIRDWIKEHNILLDIITNVINAIAFIIVAIVKFVRYVASLPVVVNVFNKIKDAFGKIFNAIGGYFEKLGNWIADTVAYFESLDEITFDDVIGAMKDFYDNFIKVIGIGIKDAFVALWDSLPSIGDILMAGLNKFKEGLFKFFDAFRGGTETATKASSSVASAFFDVIKEIFIGIFNFAKGLVTEVIPQLWEFISQLDPISAAVIAFITPIAVGISKIFLGFGGIMTGLGRAANRLPGLISSIDHMIDARKWEYKSRAMKNMAISIAILAGALFIISKIDPDRLWDSVAILGGLSAAIIGLAFAMGKVSDIMKGTKSVQTIFDLKTWKFDRTVAKSYSNMVKIILSIAGSIVAIAFAIKMIGEMDEDDLKRGSIVVGIITAIVIGFSIYFAKIDKAINNETGSIKLNGFLQMALSIFIIAMVIKMLASLELDWSVFQALGIMLVITKMLKSLMLAAKDAGEHAKDAIRSYTKIAIAMFIMALVFKLVKNDDVLASLGALGIMLVFTALLGALMWVAKNAGANAGEALYGLSKIGMAMLLMAFVAVILGNIDLDAMKQGLAGVGVLTAVAIVLALLSKSMYNFGMKNLVWMSIAIGIIAVIAIILGHIDPGAMAQGIIGVFFLSLIAVMMTRLSSVSGNIDIKALAILMGALLIITLILAILSTMDTQRAIEAGAGIGAVFIGLGVFMKFMKSNRAMTDTNVKRTITVMTRLLVMVAVIGAVLIVMSALKTENAITNAIGVSILLLALAVSFRILKGENRAFSEESMKNIIKTLGAMTIVAAALGGILALMSHLGVQNGIKNAVALGVLLLAFATAVRILPRHLPEITLSTGLFLVAMAGIVAIAAALIIEMSKMNVENGIEYAIALGIFMIAFAAAVDVTIPAMTVLAGIPLSMLAKAELAILGLGVVFEVLAAFALKLAGWATSSLPEAGTNIANMWENIKPMVNDFQSTDYSAGLDSVRQVVSLIEELGGVGFASFWKSVGTFGLGRLSKKQDLLSGIENVQNVVKGLYGIQAIKVLYGDLDTIGINSMIDSAKKAIDTISSLSETTYRPENAQAFFETLGAFKSNLVMFAMFNDKPIDTSTLDPIIDIGTKLSTLANSLPTGMSLDKIGAFTERKQSLSEFGMSLIGFAFGMTMFARMTTNNADAFSEETTAKVVSIGTMLTTLSQSMPDSKALNFADIIHGRKETLAEFGTDLMPFAWGMVIFAHLINNNKDVLTTEIAQRTSDFCSILINLANTLPEADGLWQMITGGHTELDDFAGYITKLGAGIVEFAEDVKDIDYSYGSGVDNAVKITKAMAGVATSIQNVDKDKIANFETFLKNFGGFISTFYEGIKDVDVDKIEEKTAALVQMAKDLADIDKSAEFLAVSQGFALLGHTTTEGLANSIKEGTADVISAIDTLLVAVTTYIVGSKTTFSDAMKTALSGIITGITNKKQPIQTAGKELVSSFVSGMSSKQESVKDEGKSLISNFKSGIDSVDVTNLFKSIKDEINGFLTYSKDKRSDFVDVGKNILRGLKDGVEDVFLNQALRLAAAKVVDGVLTTMMNKSEEASPSKATFRIGKFMTEGLTLGITSLHDEAVKASENLAGDTINAVSKTIANISAMVNDNIDTEPVIRPVLDLSNVQNGVKTIDSMFSANQAIRAGNGFNAGKEILVNGLVGSGGNSYNFTQNIYSPTALNRIDIYRQTKTQFSMALERMKHA